MRSHVVDTQTQIEMGPDGQPTGKFRYRWCCSCGDAGKRWHQAGGAARAARRARNGGVRHVAAMERGK